MQEFNPANGMVTAYLERLQLFVTANSIANDNLVPTLLTVVGAEHYSLLRGHVSLQLLKDILRTCNAAHEVLRPRTYHHSREVLFLSTESGVQ